jgi:hypothetical protein
MLQTSVLPKTSQVKSSPITRQDMLTQKLTHAVANKLTKQEIMVDGQKFTLLFKHGVGGNRSHYVITTNKSEAVSVPVGGKRQAEFLHSLGKPVPMETKPFVKTIESGKVLEVELSIFSRNGSSVVAVAGWSGEVETYVAKVCGELGWPYQSPRKAAFEQRVNVLRGDQSYID